MRDVVVAMLKERLPPSVFLHLSDGQADHLFLQFILEQGPDVLVLLFSRDGDIAFSGALTSRANWLWIRQIPRARSTTYAGYSKRQLIAALMDKRKLTNFELCVTLAFVGDDLPPHLKLGKAQLKTFLNTCEEVKGAAPGSCSKAVTDAAARAYVTAVFEQLAATRVTKTGMRKYKLPLGNLSTDARMEEVLATHAGMLDQVTAIALARFRPSVASAQEIQCCGADVHALPTPLLHTDVQRRAALELCRELYPSLAASSDMEVTADPRFHARVLELSVAFSFSTAWFVSCTTSLGLCRR